MKNSVNPLNGIRGRLHSFATRSVTEEAASDLIEAGLDCKELIKDALSQCHEWIKEVEKDGKYARGSTSERKAIGSINLLWEVYGRIPLDKSTADLEGDPFSPPGRGRFGEIVDILLARPKKNRSENLSNFEGLLKCLKILHQRTEQDRKKHRFERDARLKGWDNLVFKGFDRSKPESPSINDPRFPRLCDTMLGQSMFMHALENLISFCQDQKVCTNWSDYWELNIPIAKIMNGVFERPDLALQAYSRYYDKPPEWDTPTYQVYQLEILHLSEFHTLSMADRKNLLAEVYDSRLEEAETSKDRSQKEMLITLARIVHGCGKDQVEIESPSLKLTRLSQLSLLVRDAKTRDESKEKAKRPYTAYLKNFDYRTVSVIKSDHSFAPGHLKWPLQSEEIMTRFSNALSVSYKEGHSSDFLSKVFRDEIKADAQGESRAHTCKHAVWILDGEITLFYLLAILRQISRSNFTIGDWIDSKLPISIDLPAGVVCGKSHVSDENLTFPSGELRHKPSLKIASSFGSFVTTQSVNKRHLNADGGLPLFDENDMPTPRMFALMDFIQRVCLFGVSEKGAESERGTPGGKIGEFYRMGSDTETIVQICLKLEKTLREAAFLRTKEAFRIGLKDVAGSKEMQELFKGDNNLETKCRLPTFLLEILLREGCSVPFTLFFQPLIFEKAVIAEGLSILPSAFLAGTFAGLEWQGRPFLPNRFDLHLNTAIDAIRPAIDDELGRVLDKEQEMIELNEKLINEKNELRKSYGIFESIRQPIDEMIRIFRDGQSIAAQIGMAMDPAYGGLFDKTLIDKIKDLFESQQMIEIDLEWDTAWIKKWNTVSPKQVKNETKVIFTSAHKIQGGEELVENWHAILVYIFWKLGDAKFVKKTKTSRLKSDKGSYFFPRYDQFFSPKAALTELPNNHVIRFVEAVRVSSLKDISKLNLRNEKIDTCRAHYALLKLLTIDVNQQARGLYFVEVVAALAFDSSKTTKVLTDGKLVCDKDGVLYSNFDLIEAAGIQALIQIVKDDLGFSTANSTGDLKDKVDLRGRVSASQLFRELLVFLDQLKKPDGGQREMVSLESLRVEMIRQKGNHSKQICITMECANLFPDDVKKSILNFIYSGVTEYHDFRSAIRTISESVGGLPQFVQGSPENFEKRPFLIAEQSDKGTTTVVLRFENSRLENN